jgi:hypothetical protein
MVAAQGKKWAVSLVCVTLPRCIVPRGTFKVHDDDDEGAWLESRLAKPMINGRDFQRMPWGPGPRCGDPEDHPVFVPLE